MPSTTETIIQPVVFTYVERIEAEENQRKAFLQAEKERDAAARLTIIRNSGELASQINHASVEVNQDGEHSTSMPLPRFRSSFQEIAELEGQAPLVPSSSHSNDGRSSHPLNQGELATLSRIEVLESQLANQNTRIRDLEKARDDLTSEVKDLQSRRDEAERRLTEAIAKGEEARNKHEETVAALKQQLEDIIEDRRNKEKEIEELNETIRELRRELNDEREGARRLEIERENLERQESILAPSVRTASTAARPSRRASVGDNERREHKHRRNHSGHSLELTLGVAFVSNKEKNRGQGKEKKKERTKKNKKNENEEEERGIIYA